MDSYCKDCGKKLRLAKPKIIKTNSSCTRCRLVAQRGIKNPNWKGGKYHNGEYVMVRIYPEDFFYPMVKCNGYILEHRLVMAQHLGRCLQTWEIVHHKNGIKDDNRRENLELTSHLGEHNKQHSQGYRDGYQRGLLDGRVRQIRALQAEIAELKERMPE